MKYFIQTLFIVSLLLMYFGCHRKSKNGADATEKLHDNCYLNHDPGPCRMAIKRYYYDEKEKKCKEFIYGGCKGAVPFETLEECQKGCRCQ